MAALAVRQREPGVTALLQVPLFGGCFLLAGALAVVAPAAHAALLVGGLAVLRARYLYRDLLAVLLAGSMLLTYGFANLGFRLGPLPVPLAELLLLPLVAWSLLNLRGLKSIGPPLLFLALFVGLATLRLITDFPAYGKLAVRDFTLPLEALTLIAGYWVLNTYGLRWASRLFGVVLLSVVAYGLLMPWRDAVAEFGPIVGLQQPVPLLGHFDALGAAIAAAFFYFLLMLKPPWSIALAALCLVELALVQMRGLYLAVPLAALVVLIASNRLPTRLPRRIAGTVAVAAVLLIMVAPMIPSGRLGPVNTAFAISQIETLLGKEGPGDGSYAVRGQWLERTWVQQTESTSNLVFGLGLGVDLASGFTTNDVVDVRKPHNDHLEVFARLGLIGFAAWIALLASVLAPVWRAVRSDRLPERERFFLLWALALMTIYLFTALTQPWLAFPQGTIPLFLVMGISLAIARRLQAPMGTSLRRAWVARALDAGIHGDAAERGARS